MFAPLCSKVKIQCSHVHYVHYVQLPLDISAVKICRFPGAWTRSPCALDTRGARPRWTLSTLSDVPVYPILSCLVSFCYFTYADLYIPVHICVHHAKQLLNLHLTKQFQSPGCQDKPALQALEKRVQALLDSYLSSAKSADAIKSFKDFW